MKIKMSILLCLTLFCFSNVGYGEVPGCATCRQDAYDYTGVSCETDKCYQNLALEERYCEDQDNEEECKKRAEMLSKIDSSDLSLGSCDGSLFDVDDVAGCFQELEQHEIDKKEVADEIEKERKEDAEIEAEEVAIEAAAPEEDRISKVEEIIPEIKQMSKLYGYCETDEKIQSKIKGEFKGIRKNKAAFKSLKKCRRNLKKRERIIGRINEKAGTVSTCRVTVQVKPRFATWNAGLKNAKTVKSLKDFFKTVKKCLKKEKIQEEINTKFKKALGYGAVKAECRDLINSTGKVAGAHKDAFTKKYLRTCKKTARKMSKLIEKAEKNKHADTECLELDSIKKVKKCVRKIKKVKKECKKLKRLVKKCEGKEYDLAEYGSGSCSTDISAPTCGGPFSLNHLSDIKSNLKTVKQDLKDFKENKKSDKEVKRESEKLKRKKNRAGRKKSRKAKKKKK